MNDLIGIYTTVCGEDECWVEQYLKEIDRLQLLFCIHLDRCSSTMITDIISHRLCTGYTTQDNLSTEFDERDKQGPFDKVVALGCKWALALDIDETLAPNAREEIEKAITLDADYIDVKWVNLWNDPQHIRVDGPFSQGHRVKLYRLTDGFKWAFYHPTVQGLKCVGGPREAIMGKHYDLVTIHWGMITRELRIQHKERWDRIYGKAVGKNPYGFWEYACDEERFPPTIVPNPYI